MKYKLTNETTVLPNGKVLYRIQALKDFGSVKKGDLGGWIESEKNLSQDGSCWVFDQARVFGQALIFGQAQVFGEACISGEALLIHGRWTDQPCVIHGTQHIVKHIAPRTIAIGCKHHPIAYWQSHYKNIGKIRNYTPEQWEEYKLYIDLIAQRDRDLFPEVSDKGFVNNKREKRKKLRYIKGDNKMRKYRLKLEGYEYETIRFIADRYNYAQVLLDVSEYDPETGICQISDSDAWKLVEAVSDEDGFLPLMSGKLYMKLMRLANEIA